MTITLPLQPREEAKLIAVAQAKGVSADALVREAVVKILADAADQPAEPMLESRPIWEVLADNMKEVPPECASPPKTARARLIIISTAIQRETSDSCLRRYFLLGRADQHRR